MELNEAWAVFERVAGSPKMDLMLKAVGAAIASGMAHEVQFRLHMARQHPTEVIDAAFTIGRDEARRQSI